MKITGPGLEHFTRIADNSMIGDVMMMPNREPTISMALLIIIFPVLVSGTYRILITGSPMRSSV